MEDKEAIEVLKRMLKDRDFNGKEHEAILTAIGILSWSKLIEGRIQTMKRARARSDR